MKCPLCGSERINFDEEHGEYYCAICGYVIQDEELVSKLKYLGFNRGRKTKDEAIGEKKVWLELEKKRARTFVKYDKEEQLFREIERVFARFNVSNVDKAEARRLLHKVMKDDELRKYVSYCAVLIAKYVLNSKGVMVTIEQVAEILNIPNSRYKILRRVWRKLYAKGIFKKRITVAEYLYYAFDRLDIPLEFMDDAYEIWARIDGYYGGYSSRVAPKVFAGVLIHMLNKKYDLGIKLVQIAEVLGVTPLIIRLHCKNLKGVVSDENNS